MDRGAPVVPPVRKARWGALTSLYRCTVARRPRTSGAKSWHRNPVRPGVRAPYAPCRTGSRPHRRDANRFPDRSEEEDGQATVACALHAAVAPPHGSSEHGESIVGGRGSSNWPRPVRPPAPARPSRSRMERVFVQGNRG